MSIIVFGFVLNGHVILTLCGQEAGEFSRARFVLEMCWNQWFARVWLQNPDGCEWCLYISVRKMARGARFWWKANVLAEVGINGKFVLPGRFATSPAFVFDCFSKTIAKNTLGLCNCASFWLNSSLSDENLNFVQKVPFRGKNFGWFIFLNLFQHRSKIRPTSTN